MLERLEGQVETLGVGQAAGLEGFDHGGVVAGIDHDGDILVVLRRRTDHGRPADIDVLDGGRQVAVGPGHRGLEGIQVDRHQVDRLDAVLLHDRAVQVAATEDTAMHLRVQGLHPTVHHFREAGVVGHFHGRDAVVPEQLVGAAGGKDFHAEGDQLTGEVDDAGLVGNADQRAADGQAGGLVGHCKGPEGWLPAAGAGRDARPWPEPAAALKEDRIA